MRVRPVIVWVVVGLLGLALAAGVSYAATQLSSQRIGLAAEPPSAGEDLAPATVRTRPARPRVRTTPTPRRTTPVTPPPAAPTPTAPPSGGGADDGEGGGGGGGHDD